MKQTWNQKYRPKNKKDYITQNAQHKELLEQWIEDNHIPSVLFAGNSGTGKTSMANVIIHELSIDPYDVLEMNASNDNGVDSIRNRVVSFVSGMPVNSPFKIVLMNEADRLTQAAQDMLRGVMDDYEDNARFILTCNYPEKLSDPFRSRFYTLKINAPNKASMTERFLEILMKEGIKVKDLNLIESYVNEYYPNFRNLLTNAEEHSRNGTLLPFGEGISDVTEFMVNIVKYIESDDWSKGREYLAENIPTDSWTECYRFLYEYIGDIGKFRNIDNWKKGIITIADHLHKDSIVADREINFASCLASLSII